MATAHNADPQQPDMNWANNTFFALRGSTFDVDDKFPITNVNQTQLSSLYTSMPPNVLTDSSIERFGQVTPPSDGEFGNPKDSPYRKDSGYREPSISLEELQNEPNWPLEQPHGRAREANDKADASTRPAKRQRTTKNPTTAQSTATTNPSTSPEEKPRRRRGRPKAQPTSEDPGDSSSNRQTHLEKNRQAAYKCRQKKKSYISGLEEKAREGSAKNKILKETVAQLRDDLLRLKNEVLGHAGCGFWGVDEYLARCAGGLVKSSERGTVPTTQSHDTGEMARFQEMMSKRSQMPHIEDPDLCPGNDDAGMELDALLQDMDDEIEHDSFNRAHHQDF